MVHAKVGKPVPSEHALATDDDVVLKGSDSIEQSLGFAREVFVKHDRALLIKDAGMHGPCVQVNAAIEWVLLGVETHGMDSLGRAKFEPGTWQESYTLS